MTSMLNILQEGPLSTSACKAEVEAQLAEEKNASQQRKDPSSGVHSGSHMRWNILLQKTQSPNQEGTHTSVQLKATFENRNCESVLR